MIEDRVLVWRFNRGDPAALCRIYEKYRDGLLKVAAALLNDRSGVEDVLHDVFVDFAQTTGRFRLKGSLKDFRVVHMAGTIMDEHGTEKGIEVWMRANKSRTGSENTVARVTDGVITMGRKREDKMIVQFRNLGGTSSCVVHGPYGMPRELD
jgi:DNA-directed RNA polymerase specialized sigma24 family protein